MINRILATFVTLLWQIMGFQGVISGLQSENVTDAHLTVNLLVNSLYCCESRILMKSYMKQEI
jgi:hypothetical protein